MIWKFIFPAPHPKYVHPPGTTINFFHLRVNGHFGQNFVNTTYVPDGCIYMPHTLGSENQVPKVCFDAILGKKKFLKILQPNPKGNWPKSAFWDPFSWSHKICSRGAILKIRIF